LKRLPIRPAFIASDAFDTDPQRRRAVAERELSTALRVKASASPSSNSWGGLRRSVSTPARPDGLIAEASIFKLPHPLFLPFLQEIISSH